MTRQTRLLPAVVAAAACLSSGCALDRMVRAIPPPAAPPPTDKSVLYVTDDKSAAARGATPGPVQQAAATEAAPGSVPLPPPAGLPMPPAGPVPPTGFAPPAIDPHTRGTPTAAGAALGLQPWESPLDKAVELARKIDACTADNKALLARIRALEAAGDQREQAVGESVREVQAATEQVIRARADVQALRREVAVLRGKMAQMEKEDADTLRAVIEALERLLEQGGGQ